MNLRFDLIKTYSINLIFENREENKSCKPIH